MLKKLFYSLFVSSLTLALGGCGASTPAPLSPMPVSTTANIVGGEVSHQHPAVGMLLNLSSGTGQMSYCSGSIIGPHTVLTAAECVLARNAQNQTQAVLAPSAYLLFYSGSQLQNVSPRDVYKISDIVVASSQEQPFSATAVLQAHRENRPILNDLAIVHVTQPLQQTPMPITFTPPSLGDTLTLVGYGSLHAIRNDATGGIRRQTSAVVSQILPHATMFKAGSLTHGICAGDCGGPALHEGSLTGVVQNTSIGADGQCLGDNTFVTAAAWQFFIESNTY